MKIANKISFSFFAVAIVIATMAGFTVMKVGENILSNQIIAHLETTACSREDHVETYLKFIKAATAQLSKSPTLENYLQAPKDDPGRNAAFKSVMRRLAETKEANPAIHEFLVMDMSGKVVASSDPASIGQDRSADILFIEGQKKTYIKDPYFSDIFKIPMISVSAPIKITDTGKTVGVIASRNTLDDLDRITTDTTGLGRTGEIYIVNKDGYMITPSRRLKDTFLKQKVDTEYYRICMHRGAESEKSLKTVICPDYRGVMVLGTGAYIIDMQWALLAEIDMTEVFAPLRKFRFIIIFMLILAPMAAWLMGRAIAARITGPLHKLHKGTEIIAEGNLTYRVGTPAQDEIGQLSRAFDTMTSELEKKIVSIDDLNKEIAERKKAEEMLQKSEERYRFLSDNSVDLIWTADLHLNYTYLSPSVLRIYGFTQDEMVGQSAVKLLIPDSSQVAIKEFTEELTMDASRPKDRTHTVQLQHMRKDGSTIWVEVKMSFMRGPDGRPTGVLGSSRDITERRKMEEQVTQSQTMAALGRFSAGAAHEIKNPLGIILGGMEYLRAKYRDADEESKETMGMVSSAVLRVDSIINALTELAGPSEHKVRKIDAKTVVEDIVLLLGSRLKGRQITFSTAAEDGLFIEVDIDHIQYALLSILTNAADSMPGGGDVKITVRKALPATCIIEIADTGEGISEDTLPKIFEPFFTTRRDRKQIGLGLTVAKEFIRLNKGDISMASKKGEGTVVKISFPMAA